jgi:hypothetical protein
MQARGAGFAGDLDEGLVADRAEEALVLPTALRRVRTWFGYPGVIRRSVR